MNSPHVAVLKNEIKSVFDDLNDGIFVDCTLGYGGHSFEILNSKPNLRLIACDRDGQALEFSSKILAPFKNRIEIYQTNYSNLLTLIDKANIKNIKGILADIGVSSLQIDKNERGFGLNSDFLDMRMNTNDEISAYEVVNSYNEKKLAEILYNNSQLSNAKQIARKIIKEREIKPIISAKQLANIANSFVLKNRKISIATLVFQAIRIEVNNELNELEKLLNLIEKSEIKSCILAIITFHSLEDKIVKTAFKKWEKSCICPDFAIKCECGNDHAIGKILTKKPLVASKNEILQNPRSSSAKLRVFEIKR